MRHSCKLSVCFFVVKKITVQDQMARLLEFIHGGTFVVGSLFSSRVGWNLSCQLVGLSNIGGEESEL